MSAGDCSAYLMQTQLVINILKKEITTVKASLLIYDQICSGTELYVEFGRILFLCFAH